MTHTTSTGGPAGDGRPPGRDAVDSHGRALTTTPAAALQYRHAQYLVDRRGELLAAALDSDPDFAIARADLAALNGMALKGRLPTPSHTWERRHLDIVEAGAAGHLHRAADLLRDHLADVGCDPIALDLVADLVAAGTCCADLSDILAHRPSCHRGPQ
jgi:hypothetical protein